tara:strand:+ start:153 stop:497 length:345 start_codon:yes stop_codon:yes gene_type:complete
MTIYNADYMMRVDEYWKSINGLEKVLKNPALEAHASVHGTLYLAIMVYDAVHDAEATTKESTVKINTTTASTPDVSGSSNGLTVQNRQPIKPNPSGSSNAYRINPVIAGIFNDE